jgi:hypothetical protein
MDDLQALCEIEFPPELAVIKTTLIQINTIKDNFISSTLRPLTTSFR